MKKKLSVILALVTVFTMLLSVQAMAETTKTIKYYDENGNQITINGMYYNSQGYPCYNANSYYLDEDGNPVYVGGSRCYYYNTQGNLTAGKYYYNTSGAAVSNNRSYWGCGMWYYSAQGDEVNSTTYYDDFGNPIDPPAASGPATPVYRGGGCCGGGWR